MADELKEYRDHLVKADQKSQEDFDKTLITVATGSLGVSLVFMRDFVGEGPAESPLIIFVGWGLLAASVGCVLFGFYLSRFALRKAIRQIDSQSIYSEKPGGKTALVVEILNAASGVLLLLGFIAVICFAFKNLHTVSIDKEKNMANQESNPGGQRGYVPPPPPPKPIGTGKDGHQSGYIPPPPPPPKPSPPPNQ